MQTLKRTFVALSAVGLLSIPAYVAAQDPPQTPSPSAPRAEPQQPATPSPAPMPQESASSAKTQTAKGELVSVDDVAKSITIKDETGAELKFTYDAKTDVAGAKEGVAGLATRAGSKVTVKYKEEGASKMATKIDVQKAPGTQQ